MAAAMITGIEHTHSIGLYTRSIIGFKYTRALLCYYFAGRQITSLPPEK